MDEIAQFANRDKNYIRNKVLPRLAEKLEKEHPDTPNHPWQRYRTIAKEYGCSEVVCKGFKGHSQRSVRQVGYLGFLLTTLEKEAILWHMGGERICPDKQQRASYFASHLLSDIIRRADGKSIGESKSRHYPEK